MYNVIKLPAGAGKTTKAIELAVAEAKSGKNVYFVNNEEQHHSLVKKFSDALSNDAEALDRIYISTPDIELKAVQDVIYECLNDFERMGIEIHHLVADCNIDHDYFKLLAENRGIFVTYTAFEKLEKAVDTK